MEEVGLFIAVVVIVLALPVSMIVHAITHRRELEEKYEKRMAAYRERTDCESDRIVEVKYLGTGEIRQKRGGLGGALLGGFFGGPIGAMVGAVLPKNIEGLQRFAVKYGDGRVVIKEVHTRTTEYKRLMSMVEWEEL